MSILSLTALPTAEAAASSGRTLPPGDICAQDESVVPATTVHTQFHLQDLGGALGDINLLCGTPSSYGLRHIDDGHHPTTGDLDVLSLLTCINNVAGTRHPVLSYGKWQYDRTDARGTWRVIVDPNYSSVTTAFRVGTGHRNDDFHDCL
ncbi:hypothetical protein [Kitasatospora sp. NPDC094016]|uniref:hypothetical protein n=1 Tax=Kitasatospora sp. NPDC094016 TaxID=3154986 RepID=UPI00332A9B3E